MMLIIQLCHQRNKLHFAIYYNRTKTLKLLIFHNITVFPVFLIKENAAAALVSMRDLFFKNNKTSY